MNRILFFVHYNKYGGLSDHVLYLLEHIKHIYNRIVLISNSPISDAHDNKLTGLYDTIIIRENKGFDFGAWKDAILAEGWDTLAQYDNLTLMNDTCFGPIFDLEPVYAKMEQAKSDFWGLTNHPASEHGMPGTNGPVPEHIQSYFLCCNKNVVQSSAFQIFWNKMIYDDRDKVIQKYETQFTSILNKAGFKHTVFFDLSSFTDIRIHPEEPSNHPDLSINSHIPLTKIKSFIYFPYPQYINRIIREKTDYPVSLIYDYFAEMYEPNTSIFIGDKLIPAQADNMGRASSSLKIAVHLHVFYLDVFEKYIAILDNSPVEFDLFITTDTLEKKNDIEKYVHNHAAREKIKEIIICENKGRDIFCF